MAETDQVLIVTNDAALIRLASQEDLGTARRDHHRIWPHGHHHAIGTLEKQVAALSERLVQLGLGQITPGLQQSNLVHLRFLSHHSSDSVMGEESFT
jgi:hypothetical protein